MTAAIKPELVYRILSKDGDMRIVWDRDQLSEINDAKNKFDELVGKGMVPYKVDPSGQKTAELMTVFDPSAEEILFSPIKMLVGG